MSDMGIAPAAIPGSRKKSKRRVCRYCKHEDHISRCQCGCPGPFDFDGREIASHLGPDGKP